MCDVLLTAEPLTPDPVGVYESELERIGNVYMLRDEAPHRLQTLTVEAMMATGVYGFRCVLQHFLRVVYRCPDIGATAEGLRTCACGDVTRVPVNAV